MVGSVIRFGSTLLGSSRRDLDDLDVERHAKGLVVEDGISWSGGGRGRRWGTAIPISHTVTIGQHLIHATGSRGRVPVAEMPSADPRSTLTDFTT